MALGRQVLQDANPCGRGDRQGSRENQRQCGQSRPRGESWRYRSVTSGASDKNGCGARQTQYYQLQTN